MILLLLMTPSLWGSELDYVYAPAGGSTLMSGGALEETLRIIKRYPRGFLWVRLDDRQYLSRDADLLREVQRAIKPLQELEEQREAVHKRMRLLERQHDRLDEEADELRDLEERLTGSGQARLREIERSLKLLEPRIRALEAEEERLDRREDEHEAGFEQQLLRLVRRAIGSGAAAPL